MRILISGASGGLGKYLAEQLTADRFDRAAACAPQGEYDTIVHCAFDVRRQVPPQDEAAYQRSTTGLTQVLLNIPHRQFVFISSCEVYLPSDTPHAEDEKIDHAALPDRYGKSKLEAEKQVLAQAVSPLILRPTAMLGPTIRPSSLTKILSGENPKLTLSATSTFNYVLHEDILAFLHLCFDLGLGGVFNIAASDNVSLEEVCAAFSKTAQFGDYEYRTPKIDNRKAAALLSAFSHSSMEIVRRFAASVK